MDYQLADITNKLNAYCEHKSVNYELKLVDNNGTVTFTKSNRSNYQIVPAIEHRPEDHYTSYVQPPVLKPVSEISNNSMLPLPPPFNPYFQITPPMSQPPLSLPPISVYHDKQSDKPANLTLEEQLDIPDELTTPPSKHWSKIQLNLLNKIEVKNYFHDGFEEIQQIACKDIAKAWIKIIEPRKQTHYPYKRGEKGRPSWWPTESRHKEPDHLKKHERLALLTKIIQTFRNAHNDMLKSGISILKESTEQFPRDRSMTIARRIIVLEEIFKVLRASNDPSILLRNPTMVVLRLGREYPAPISLEEHSHKIRGLHIEEDVEDGSKSKNKSKSSNNKSFANPFSTSTPIVLNNRSSVSGNSLLITPQKSHSYIDQFIQFPSTLASDKVHTYIQGSSLPLLKDKDKENQIGTQTPPGSENNKSISLAIASPTSMNMLETTPSKKRRVGLSPVKTLGMGFKSSQVENTEKRQSIKNKILDNHHNDDTGYDTDETIDVKDETVR